MSTGIDPDSSKLETTLALTLSRSARAARPAPSRVFLRALAMSSLASAAGARVSLRRRLPLLLLLICATTSALGDSSSPSATSTSSSSSSGSSTIRATASSYVHRRPGEPGVIVERQRQRDSLIELLAER